MENNINTVDLSNFDGIEAEDLKNIGSSTSKARILGYLGEVQQMPSKSGKPIWVSIRSISQQAKVSNVYTRNVLSQLVESGQVEMGKDGKKAYYRLKPVVTTPESHAAV